MKIENEKERPVIGREAPRAQDGQICQLPLVICVPRKIHTIFELEAKTFAICHQRMTTRKIHQYTTHSRNLNWMFLPCKRPTSTGLTLKLNIHCTTAQEPGLKTNTSQTIGIQLGTTDFTEENHGNQEE